MKGLALNATIPSMTIADIQTPEQRKEEAYELVRKGLRHDLRSHVCWHVFSLLHRSDRNYTEATKCCLNALRINPGDNQILRDLACLQVQMRDLQGHVESRNKMLTLKATKVNWMSYAVANDVADHSDVALKVLDTVAGLDVSGCVLQ